MQIHIVRYGFGLFFMYLKDRGYSDGTEEGEHVKERCVMCGSTSIMGKG